MFRLHGALCLCLYVPNISWGMCPSVGGLRGKSQCVVSCTEIADVRKMFVGVWNTFVNV